MITTIDEFLKINENEFRFVIPEFIKKFLLGCTNKLPEYKYFTVNVAWKYFALIYKNYDNNTDEITQKLLLTFNTFLTYQNKPNIKKIIIKEPLIHSKTEVDFSNYNQSRRIAIYF